MKSDIKRFFSNCLLEALKAKHKDKSIKIKYISPFQNYRSHKVFCPHWFWIDGEYKCWFFASHKLRWWEFLWHEGFIWKENIETKDQN